MLDPMTMIADLRRRAQKLLNAAEAIEEAYGTRQISAGLGVVEHNRSATVDMTMPVLPGERKQQLIKFLMEQGPKRRSEIKISSGIPVGTISNLLKDDSAFEKLPDGRWGAKSSD